MTADIGRPEQQVTGWASECGRGPAWGTSVNLPVPAGTGDASWLRAFHAVVPAVVRAFGPEVLVTHHGADTHREDPLADLNLTVDGQRTSYLALRELAETVTGAAGSRWVAVPFPPWDGEFDQAVDRAIQDDRTAISPLHGLDPHDPRD